MGKTYRASEEDDIRPVDVEFQKRTSSRRVRDRWDMEFEQHQAAQTKDKRGSLSINGYQDRD